VFSIVAWREEDGRAVVRGAKAATEGPATAKRVKENFIVTERRKKGVVEGCKRQIMKPKTPRERCWSLSKIIPSLPPAEPTGYWSRNCTKVGEVWRTRLVGMRRSEGSGAFTFAKKLLNIYR
jgi:hypothetical protein